MEPVDRLTCSQLLQHEYFDGFREQFEVEMHDLLVAHKPEKQRRQSYKTRETRTNKPSTHMESSTTAAPKNHLPQLSVSSTLPFLSNHDKDYRKDVRKKYDGHLPSIPPR